MFSTAARRTINHTHKCMHLWTSHIRSYTKYVKSKEPYSRVTFFFLFYIKIDQKINFKLKLSNHWKYVCYDLYVLCVNFNLPKVRLRDVTSNFKYINFDIITHVCAGFIEKRLHNTNRICGIVCLYVPNGWDKCRSSVGFMNVKHI